MNELKIFKNENFGKVRTLVIDEEPWFVGKDVAVILGYTNTPKAIKDHVDDEDKLIERIVISGQNRDVILINESGLYSLILSSKMPKAKEFKRWVTSEVLPSIRKHGAYMTNETLEKAITSPDFIIKLATKLKEEMTKREELENEKKLNAPKVKFADAVATSNTSILVGELAKILKQNGVDIGQQRLFSWLRDNGYLIKRKGLDWNMPTQKSMELGLFEIKETVVPHLDGHASINRTTKVTGKGQQYIINKFLSA